jgi:peptidoglycan/LPS O-acetylase OafA/YrhL
MRPVILPGLTPLRGIAALHVFWLHYSTQVFPATGGGDVLLVTNGRLAVEFFFILSGIVLAHAYGDRFSQGVDPAGWLDFMVNRLARIWPLAAAMAVLSLGLFLVTTWWATGWSNPLTLVPLTGRQSWVELLSLVTLTSGFFENVRWNYPQWSITAEMIGYLLAPFAIAAVATAERRHLWWIAALGLLPHLALDLFSHAIRMAAGNVLSVSWRDWSIVIGGPADGVFLIHSGVGIAARCIGLMVTGVALYRLWRCGALAWLQHPLQLPLALTALVVTLTLPRPDTLILLAMLWTIAAAMAARGRAAALLNARPLAWLGEISFSIYLLHAPLQLALKNVADAMDVKLHDLDTALSLGLLALSTVVVVGLSHLTWQWIEVPARRGLRTAWQRHRASGNGPARPGPLVPGRGNPLPGV